MTEKFIHLIAAVLLVAVCIQSRPRDVAGAGIPGSVFTSKATQQRVVALTFDDGPSLYTRPVLQILRIHRVHATFFVIGRQVARDPAAVRAVVAAGDEIGNHTYTHTDLEFLNEAADAAELTRTDAAVEAASGTIPLWFRPPYGAIDGRIARLAASVGLQPITWSVDPADWSLPGTSLIVSRVLLQVRPGGVILLHDGGGNRSETLAALPSIVEILQARGYHFLTLSELFGAVPMPVPPR
ncbi:MAG TPA: polysaccharide deacetylase family protein [Chloroflexota bacterium]